MSTEPGGLQETAAVLRDVDEVRGLEEDRIGGLYIGIGGGGGGGGGRSGQKCGNEWGTSTKEI